MAVETYQAKADPQIALAVAGTDSPFTIEVRFLGGLTETRKNAFKAAADRWSRVIVGDLPSVMVNGELIDDVLIIAEGADIDGPGKILGQAVDPPAACECGYCRLHSGQGKDDVRFGGSCRDGTAGHAHRCYYP